MQLSMVLFFTLLSANYITIYATEYNGDIYPYLVTYKNQSKLDKQLVKKIQKQKPSDTAIKVLLDLQAKPNAIDKEGNTLLHTAIGKTSENRLLLIKTLLSYKGDVNIYNSDKRTAFHTLCHFHYRNNDYNEIIKCFLQAGGNPTIKDNCNRTPFTLFIKNYVKVTSIDKNTLNAFIECKADLSYLLQRSLQNYHTKINSDQKEIFELISLLLEKKADLNVINKTDIYRYDTTFTPQIIQIFLHYKMDPTIATPCCCGPNWVCFEKKFGYEWTQNKDKRNLLAYAIPLYIQKHHIPKWKTLLLCLNDKKKTCSAFKVPKYLKILFCGDIFEKINQTVKEIQKLEGVIKWDDEANAALALRNTICQLIDMHNKDCIKIQLKYL